MTSFNQFKNNTEILKKYLSKMNSISQCVIKPQLIDQNFLRDHNPLIFLQILHYILIKFSPFVLFVKILDLYPTIKDDSDKKFLTNTMSLARKMFEMDVKIDLDQFLSSKFVQKKTQFTSTLCRLAYQLHLKQNKSTVGNGNPRPLKKQTQKQTNFSSRVQNKQIIDDDSQDQMPRNLNIAPLKGKTAINLKKQKQSSSSDEDLKQLLKKKQQIKTIKQKSILKNQNLMDNTKKQFSKPNVFPKKQLDSDDDQQNQFTQQSYYNKLQQNRKFAQKHKFKNQQRFDIEPQKLQKKNIIQVPKRKNFQNQTEFKENETNYVTRQQFMEIISSMTNNFTQLLGKFNDFQSQVGNWVQNVNAKISILEENVKTIKNNL